MGAWPRSPLRRKARSDVDRGVSAAQTGLEAVRAGDTEAVADQLARAEAALLSADGRIGGFAARTLLALPIAAQHLKMTRLALIPFGFEVRERY